MLEVSQVTDRQPHCSPIIIIIIIVGVTFLIMKIIIILVFVVIMIIAVITTIITIIISSGDLTGYSQPAHPVKGCLVGWIGLGWVGVGLLGLIGAQPGLGWGNLGHNFDHFKAAVI